MLKIISSGKNTDVTVAGGLDDVIAELGIAIGSLYAQIAAQNRDAAKMFRCMLMRMVDPESPMWRVDVQTPRCALVRDHKQGFSADDISTMVNAGAPVEAIKAALQGI